MIIDLASVSSEPRPLAADIDGPQIDLEGEGTVIGVAHLEGEAFREGLKTHLRATVKAEVEIVCSRCTEPVTRLVDTPFEDVFVDAAYEPREKDLEVAGSELDEELVESNEIDLADVVREQILLDLPEQVLCKEDCKGLCPHCGANRNLIDCDCGEKDIDPRWAALKDLN